MVAKNSDGLVREVARQVKARAIHLPEGMKQRIMIDVRGQSVNETLQLNLRQKLVEKSNSILHPNDIRFIEK